MASTDTCTFCQRIAQAVVARANIPGFQDDTADLDMGTWQELLDRQQCLRCQNILQFFRNSRSWSTMYQPSYRLTFGRGFDVDEFRLKLLFALDDGFAIAYLSLIPIEICGEKWPGYLPVNQAKIDVRRLVTWSNYCDQNHQGKCHTLPQWKTFTPASSIIFIDVEDSCLVQISGQVRFRYLTLSYVWGKSSESIHLTTENFSQMCSKASFELQNGQQHIPNTIRHAMILTREVGLRYIWVDRLCIIQNEPTHITNQLQQMAQIYANSYFTIIAADGPDANYGLYGIDPECLPRSIIDTPFEFNADVKMVETPGMESIFEKPFWHTRAWTFQERAVSRRTLVFTQNTVYWQCRGAAWYEKLAAEPEGKPLRIRYSTHSWPSYSLEMNPWPALDHYFKLVAGYNHRNLSFESDALNAFKAITAALSKSFPGGFYFGSPVFLFDLAMLWSGKSSLRRRSGFPSWSWVGWSGEVDLPIGYEDVWQPDFDDGDFAVDIRPLVIWYATNADQSSHHEIDNSYHQYKADIWNPTYSPPVGWTRTWNEEHEAEAFQHDGLPNYLFKYPFPVFPSVTEDVWQSSFPYLQCVTQSCMLLLDTAYISFDGEELLTVNLRDDEDHWSGVIQSVFTSDDQYIRGASCELVAISEGRARRDCDFEKPCGPIQPFTEMDQTQEIRDREEYVFVNVIWIEWIENVAYRKAVGRVWEEAWKRQVVNTINLVLG